MSNKIVLGHNQYGKAEVRVVKITRDTDRHEIEDLNVTSQLRGDFEAAHLEGDNAHVVATDTQKNTIYAFAREGVGSPEAFLLRLGEHFTSSFDWVTGGRWEAESYAWERIQAHGSAHDHSFVRKGQEVRTAVLVRDGAATHLISGLKDLTVLKSTQSGFVGYPKDKYTTLPETTDRILATDVSARWRFKAGTDFSSLDFNKSYEDVKSLLLEGFTENYSHALQQTLFDMGTKVLEATARSRKSSSRCPTSTTSSWTSRRSGSTTRTRSSSRPIARTGSSRPPSCATTPKQPTPPGQASPASAKPQPAAPRKRRSRGPPAHSNIPVLELHTDIAASAPLSPQ
jgi:urate oxidase